MTKFSENFSRRKFIVTAGASAVSSILLKGCLGNPPEPGGTADGGAGGAGGAPAATSAVAVANEKRVEGIESTKITLGYIPIVESAPLIIAQEKGFFAKYGMVDVKVAKQANWGSARDNVEIGSAGGGIDGGQWQMPMPYLISKGLITKNKAGIPMYVLLQLNTQGNGIAIAAKHEGKGLGLKLEKSAQDYILGLKKAGTPFKAAYTFPKANQDLWIRYWLAANGINPDVDVELLTVPAAQTVANMKTGSMDGFSTGDPWPLRIVKEKIGFLSALTAEMWKGHPEEYLAIRGDWVDKHPKATEALLAGIIEAQQWCDKPENRAELVSIVSGKNFFDVAPGVLLPPYEGKYIMGDGKPEINDFKMSTLYWNDGVGNVSYPYKSHDLWFLTESVRWGFLPTKTLADSKTIIDKVNRGDLWKAAAKLAGVAEADIPAKSTRGIEKFFDGKEFNPDKPEEYIKSLAIKKA
ncbi:MULTISPECIES: CmpA/NrtA family ABC transporter substrate-binding protein [unclassified Microcoleus]|uniref:CmpA/NrtA family ABC transporter substrate-binding protein n=1 Tax=unclassified Microcoleus TaxID=2642155 RepID=UPI001D3FFAA9|nr:MULTISPECIES: CmpA/NrtA family ABC transporter substrate-binding protein [unclassified Microcoleus]MCC3600744.1 ABC transporter substrate-binding protein [Microcoleus sp. PH2017_26_ELK_O_A]MCC3625883.1 ABC transporter substrate-binding protein [Microcoleus sp. PH2017_36_ELK_O_B]